MRWGQLPQCHLSVPKSKINPPSDLPKPLRHSDTADTPDTPDVRTRSQPYPFSVCHVHLSWTNKLISHFTVGGAEEMDIRSLRDESIKWVSNIHFQKGWRIEPQLISHFCRSPFSRGGRSSNIKSYAELSPPEGADISFVSSGRSSGFSSGMSSGRPSIDHMYPPRLSNGFDSLDRSFESSRTPHRSSDAYSIGNDYSYRSSIGTGTSWSSENMVSAAQCNNESMALNLDDDPSPVTCL